MTRRTPPGSPFTHADLVALSEKAHITEEDVFQMAAAVTGSEVSATIFMDRPLYLLHDRTPREAVRDGEGRRLMGMLLNAAGL